MSMIEDSDGTEEEYADQYEITDKSNITEEDMKKITDSLMKELQPAMDKIHQRLENIENIASANK
eukprot:14239326-Heterocapsa_arctica.AAC.1